MRAGDREFAVVGHARWENDADLGNVLRITVDDLHGVHEVLIAATQWNGAVVDGGEYGCDYCLIPQSSPVT
jgi:hypothetical protein